jgi:adenine-specific DNA-methyltransferase
MRTNIITEELRDFVAEDEQTPKTKLYTRDQWLDLKLVRKGKDKQASRNLIGGTKNHNFGEFYRWIEIV